MAISTPRRRSSEVVGEFGPLGVERHEVAAEGGEPFAIYTLRLADWVTVAAVTDDGRFVLVRQHRFGIDAATIEPAGGVIDPGEDPEASALRELVEETGYEARAIVSLGWVHPNPAMQANRCFLYLAQGARPALDKDGRLRGPGDPADATESTEPVLMTPAEVEAAIRDGRISHSIGVLVLERALTALR
jgi:ADP-ribose pyrophosphatase YjhB (NUDIX family)